MMTRLYEVYKNAHEVAVTVLSYTQPLLTPEHSEVDVQTALMELNSYISANAYKLKASDEAVPPGYWYMATVTQSSSLGEADAVRLHQTAMQYFQSAGVKVYLASLEHSAIWHMHYLICCSTYSKNLARDLGKATKTRVQIERKISSAKKWAGACNYIAKRNYADDSTHVRMLVEELVHTDGKGWGFKA